MKAEELIEILKKTPESEIWVQEPDGYAEPMMVNHIDYDKSTGDLVIKSVAERELSPDTDKLVNYPPTCEICGKELKGMEIWDGICRDCYWEKAPIRLDDYAFDRDNER